MKQFKLSMVLVAVMTVLTACGSKDGGTAGDAAESAKKAAPAAETAAVKFVTTQDGSELKIDAKLFKTAAAKEFLSTGKNPYVGDAEAEARGKKVFGLYSCTQCHGPDAKGQVGPGLVGPTFKYPKNATNKGMFETIWNGTNGGMGGKGWGIMAPDNGMTPDEILKVIAWVRTQGTEGVTGNE